MKMYRLLGCAIAIALTTGFPAQAQTTIDMSKITCEQWLTFKVADPDQIAVWLAGWYGAKRNSTLVEVQVLKETAGRLKDVCVRNLNVPLMKVIDEQILSKKQ
jgi:acid stress chaperone HdeB